MKRIFDYICDTLKLNEMKKIAIYTRVSTQEQTTKNQTLRLTAYAKEQGWEYTVYEETQSTRKTRPIKANLIKELRSGKYDGVLVYKLDRWARSSTELILEINELIKKGIDFYSYSENLDFTTATGKLHFNILSAFAEFERELIRERTIEGLRRAKAEGKRAGRPKGSKDSTPRKKDGYFFREQQKREQKQKILPQIINTENLTSQVA